MRKYWVLATGWPEGVWPNDELWQIIAGRAGELMLSGQLVLGTLGTRDEPLGRMNAEGTARAPWIPDWRCTWISEGGYPQTWDELDHFAPTKHLRIFTSEAAALEFADFVLGHGAEFSIILSEEEVEQKCPLPADQYIDAMIVDPADTQRIAFLQARTATLEHMQYYRTHKRPPPNVPFLN